MKQTCLAATRYKRTIAGLEAFVPAPPKKNRAAQQRLPFARRFRPFSQQFVAFFCHWRMRFDRPSHSPDLALGLC
jgi:hypothetical protein